MNIAISGLGRIGKNFLRVLMSDKQALKGLSIKAVNIGPACLDTLAHLLTYDSLMGTYPGTIELKENTLLIDGHDMVVYAELDPAKLPWRKHNIDWVVDCSGKFTDRAGAQKHLEAGAKRILISAPAKEEDVTIIPGVNDVLFNAEKHAIVSLGSCTTNALAPMLKVLHDNFVVEQAFMTTIHAYTNSQVLIDVDCGADARRSRAAALNLIPTTTGATKVIDRVLPELSGKVHGHALRVPVAKGSLIDLSIITSKPLTPDAINSAFCQAHEGALNKIIDLTMAPLVSSDANGTEYSVIIDGLLTQAQGNMGKVFGWYDNEWAYSVRMKDFLLSVR